MPPSDQEPRYQLVDSNGNVVGSLFGDGSGNVVIADETDTQTTFGTDGISTPALEADKTRTKQLHARAGPSSKQGIPSGTSTQIQLDSTKFIDSDVIQISSDQFVVQEDGIYSLGGIIAHFNDDSGSNITTDVYVNSTRNMKLYLHQSSDKQPRYPISWEGNLNAQDTVHVEVIDKNTNPSILQQNDAGTNIILSRRG